MPTMPTMPTMLTILTTSHFEIRRKQRGLKESICDVILELGTEIKYQGTIHIAIRKNITDESFPSKLIEEARHWVLVFTRDGSKLATCYARADAFHYISSEAHASKHHYQSCKIENIEFIHKKRAKHNRHKKEDDDSMYDYDFAA